MLWKTANTGFIWIFNNIIPKLSLTFLDENDTYSLTQYQKDNVFAGPNDWLPNKNNNFNSQKKDTRKKTTLVLVLDMTQVISRVRKDINEHAW